MLDSNLIINILIAFGAFQALFIASILLRQDRNKLARRLFAIFLIIEGITLIERLLVMTDLIVSVPHILGVSYPISFIKAPFLLFMAWAITNSNFKLHKIHLWHLVPFALILLMNIPFYLQTASYKLDFVRAFVEHVPSYQSFDFYLSLSFFLHIGLYITATILILKKYTTQVKNNKLASWYLKILWFYSATLLINLIYFVILPSGLLEIQHFHIVSMLVMTFLIQSIAYGFFMRSDIFQHNLKQINGDSEKLSHNEQLIKDKFENEKVFRDDSLTLVAFAKAIDLPKNYVSDLINQRFGVSFKDLVNRYRIEEAIDTMTEKADSKIRLIEIAQEVGFNNKVSFYRAFKAQTGKSPSEYFKHIKETV